jgi:hypothetical protein
MSKFKFPRFTIIYLAMILTTLSWYMYGGPNPTAIMPDATPLLDAVMQEDRPLSRMVTMGLEDRGLVETALSDGHSVREVEIFMAERHLAQLLPYTSGNALDGYLALSSGIMSDNLRDNAAYCIDWAVGKAPAPGLGAARIELMDDWLDAVVLGYNPRQLAVGDVMPEDLFELTLIANFTELGQQYGWSRLNLEVLSEPDQQFLPDDLTRGCFTMIALFGAIQRMPEQVRYPFLRKLLGAETGGYNED